MLTGGKFSNGAVTAAFAHMYNQEGGSKLFGTEQEAAMDALNAANPKSIETNYEYGGVIYYDSFLGYYSYTTVSQAKADGVEIDLSNLPAQGVIVADYHTHGDYSTRNPQTWKIIRTTKENDTFNSDDFSETDKMSNDGLNRPGYLGTPSGKYRLYDPSTRNTRDFTGF